jgi:NADH-quinone oxidoreductase subunit H
MFLETLVPLLISVAYFTLIERQILGNMQRRLGPNVVGVFGLLQPIADGVKLLLKESILPRSSNFMIFVLAPVFTFALAVSAWVVVPFGEGMVIADVNLGLLYIFAVSSLSVHSVIMAGWSSNSKYAFLGALRSAAQMISYELSLGVTIVSVVLCANSVNLTDIVVAQKDGWFFLALLPMFLIFFICTLAETNRHPFDLPEAEAELVAGYNVEYSAMGFALFFLAEYGNIILMCILTSLLFLGGWQAPIELNLGGIFDYIYIPGSLWLSLKTLIFIVLFIALRGALPRYRYDQLMRLGWKVFLPLALGIFVIEASILYSLNALDINY